MSGTQKPNKRSGLVWLAVILAVFALYSINRQAEKELKDTLSTVPANDRDLGSLWTSLNTAPTSPRETNAPAQASTQGGLSYADDRIPNYVALNPRWESLRFEWKAQNGRGAIRMDLSVDAKMYEHYRGLGRYQGVENYGMYINDTNNKALIAEIVRVLREVGEDISYTDSDLVRECAKFVQETIEYQYDIDSAGQAEYPRYPIETLYERRGDCEDTSILMAALLKELGYDVGFLHIPGHVAVAIRTTDDYQAGMYYEINGRKYLYIESTAAGWNIGDIPEEYWETEATFYRIS